MFGKFKFCDSVLPLLTIMARIVGMVQKILKLLSYSDDVVYILLREHDH